jgi:hypothetical protein
VQRMESSSYARSSKTAEAAMDSSRMVQQETTWKQPEQMNGGYKGRYSNYNPHYSSSNLRRRHKQERRENSSDYYETESSPRPGVRVQRSNAQRRNDRKHQEEGEQ